MFLPFADDGQLAATPLPPMVRCRHIVPAPCVTDLPGAVNEAVRQAGLPDRIRPGMRIALGIGSRGINHIGELARATVRALEGLGAEVFIVPAMGSHGASTAEGQRDVLATFGISEALLGVKILATMDVEPIGTLPEGMKVYMDRIALAADGIVVLGRTKPHTDFHGPIESGAAKMVAVGLGKQVGAQQMHSFGVEGLRDLMPKAARLAVREGNVLGAIEVVENAEEEPAIIAGLGPEDIGGEAEERLLRQAKDLIGRLPFDDLDVLVIDYMGKNISGSGMDTNVVGRMLIPGFADPPLPRYRLITVLDLTEEAHGNAFGIGLADVTTRRLWEKIDLQTFYINCMTAGLTGVQRAKLPMALANPRLAVAAALRMCGRPNPASIRMARIRDTLRVGEFLATEAALDGVTPDAKIERMSDPRPWAFEQDGMPMW
jgi:lactate racemase-like protein